MAKAIPSKQLLRAAGLVFTHDGMPGYHRRRSGRGFSYLTPAGDLLKDREEVSRIRSLVIPPAYERVWVCPVPEGHLQATGFDQRGRKQYRYHPGWHELAGDRKFDQLPAFAKALPRIRQHVRAALSQETLGKDRIVAGIVALLDETGFRIGNARYARDNKSFGLVSLLSRHLSETEDGWALQFRGKSGKDHEADIRNPRISTLISELQELPGQRLFRYEDEDGGWHDIGTTEVNAWLKEHGGGDFTAKQFRTWRATVLCAIGLGIELPPESEAARRRAELTAIKATAQLLNHTPATCRKYYLYPAIFRAYRDGVLYTAMHSPPPGLRKSDGSSKLKAHERRVLALIESGNSPSPRKRPSPSSNHHALPR
ncbi:MAG: topoisomerase [Akkermansiaceae bacterium]|nr:topoisomerase [Akkermansiaceae bacterium]